MQIVGCKVSQRIVNAVRPIAVQSMPFKNKPQPCLAAGLYATSESDADPHHHIDS
jgi:hypothetical protein